VALNHSLGFVAASREFGSYEFSSLPRFLLTSDRPVVRASLSISVLQNSYASLIARPRLPRSSVASPDRAVPLLKPLIAACLRHRQVFLSSPDWESRVNGQLLPNTSPVRVLWHTDLCRPAKLDLSSPSGDRLGLHDLQPW